MTKANALPILAIILALGITGCATAQPKEPQAMLIDKIPPLKWHAQITLSKDQYKEQQKMIDQIDLLLKGKYEVTASKFYELELDEGVHIPESSLPTVFHNMMGDLHLSQVFENSTIDEPFLTVWKTSGPHPEYVAAATSDFQGRNTLLGYFELEATP